MSILGESSKMTRKWLTMVILLSPKDQVVEAVSLGVILTTDKSWDDPPSTIPSAHRIHGSGFEYLHENHQTEQPNVDTYAIHGSCGLTWGLCHNCHKEGSCS